MKHPLCVLAIVAGLGILGSGSILSAATLININARGHNSNPAPFYTGEGVIGALGDYWNGFIPSTELPMALSSSTGQSLPGVTFSLSGTNTQYRHVADSSAWYGTPEADLMANYLYSSANTEKTLTISGLTAGQEFELYIYSVGGQTSANHWSTAFTLAVANGGGAASALNVGAYSAPNTFVQNTNYVHFTGVVALDGTVAVSFSAPVEGYFNGMQLAVIPEPGHFALFAVGLGLLGCRLRKNSHCRPEIS